MRIWALILLLLSCIVGFAASYGIAYNTVSGVFSTTQTSTAAPATAQR